jgi:hypothetical protein
MGKPGQSDAEKKFKGTFDARFSETARAARAESNVITIFGDRLEAVPDPTVDLAASALSFYRKWTQRLFDLGKLSELSVMEIQAAAQAQHNIEVKMREGKIPRGGDQAAVTRFLNRMRELNVDAPSSPSQGSVSKWSAIGFAARSQQGVKR